MHTNMTNRSCGLFLTRSDLTELSYIQSLIDYLDNKNIERPKDLKNWGKK